MTVDAWARVRSERPVQREQTMMTTRGVNALGTANVHDAVPRDT